MSNPRSTRRIGRRLGAIAVTAGMCTLAACGGAGTDAEGGSGETVTLQFVHPEVAGSFDPLVKAYEAEHPNVRIETTNVPFDQLQSTLQSRLGQGDTSIDVYTADPSRIPGIVARGQLLEISDLRDEAEAATIPSAMEPNIVDGSLWSLPIWTSSQYLYYNPDLLAQAGVEPPTKDPAKRWTWKQVTDAARKAQAAGAEHGLLIEQVNRYYQLQPLAESLGGGPGLEGDDLLTPNLTNDPWITAMNWYQDIHEQGIAPRGIAPDQMGPLFSAGKAAFYVGGPWVIPGWKEEGATFGLAPHPYFAEGEPTTPTDSWSWGINPNSENVEQAKEFLRWAALTTEGSLATIEKILIPPTNANAFDKYVTRLDESVPGVTDGAGDLMLHELENTAVHRPPSPGYIQFEEMMVNVFEDIRNGSDVEDRLAKAEDELATAFSRLR
ncbi:carbohydrate ABC transporter substrate-binding protein (CUT1 family) [Haloactinopolyspora alba]|uniref:Carbohydrate ABC transporter substrate-binding protein (CUT1 family) n=1 Tax=Haloactinopolyspora alba TaxID=648780 RepID=A0A2P8E8Y2_9ACTN|nr:sugar ABC transporter substrate-binding protein [Haloactinopolyspora alba]PSL05857.1 carbohydrate ABC transporter substrate-binding protein (CUT1 family) [Haloactinopolyspora alba]